MAAKQIQYSYTAHTQITICTYTCIYKYVVFRDLIRGDHFMARPTTDSMCRSSWTLQFQLMF